MTFGYNGRGGRPFLTIGISRNSGTPPRLPATAVAPFNEISLSLVPRPRGSPSSAGVIFKAKAGPFFGA